MKKCGWFKLILGALLSISSGLTFIIVGSTNNIPKALMLCTGLALFAIGADEVITNRLNSK